MSALKFHTVRIKEIRPETADCVSVVVDVPEDLRQSFVYEAGQYLTFRTYIDGNEVRRSYSICSGMEDNELRVAVKKVEQGKFSTYANEVLKKGDWIDVMAPMGKFSPRKDETGAYKGKNFVAFVAGSGITPVLSIMKTVLSQHPESTFTLVYGNKNRNTIIFREAIEGLKNKYMNRIRLYHILSREKVDVDLFNGRIDSRKCSDLLDTVLDSKAIDEAFICGPESMILSVRESLLNAGLREDQIHLELFSSPDQPTQQHKEWKEKHRNENDGLVSKVSIRLDGSTFDIDLPYNGDTILDAALKNGADLPYACKGGVCCTCKAKIIEGMVDMEVNYALEKDELEKGFVLSCQSHPRSERVIIDFDAR